MALALTAHTLLDCDVRSTGGTRAHSRESLNSTCQHGLAGRVAMPIMITIAMFNAIISILAARRVV